MVAAIDQFAVGSNNLNAQLGAAVHAQKKRRFLGGLCVRGVILWRQRNFGNRMRRDHRRQILAPGQAVIRSGLEQRDQASQNIWAL
jgi:hypothetical protein